MDDPMFGVENVETVIGTVAVLLAHKIVVKQEDVILQVSFKLLNILPRPLATPELPPGGKKIL